LRRRRGAGARTGAIEDGVDRLGVEGALDLGLVAGSFEPCRGEHGREVEQRAGDGRDGQAVVAAVDVVWVKEGGPVHADAFDGPALAERRDVDACARRRRELPDRRGGSVADHGCLLSAAGEEGGPQSPPRRQPRVADGVHPAVQAQQPPAPAAQVDRSVSEPARAQLCDRHDAVLARGERRHRNVRVRVKKPFGSMVFLTHAPQDAPAARDRRRL
jgi:hypothetical protein